MVGSLANQQEAHRPRTHRACRPRARRARAHRACRPRARRVRRARRVMFTTGCP